MTAMEQEPKKKAKKTLAVELAAQEYGSLIDAKPEVVIEPLHVVEKPKPKPGDKDYDWQAEYPGEKVYVYTVPDTAKVTAGGKQSPIGLTIGLAGMSEDRAPNPGEMMEAEEIGGFKPMWVFISYVTSPTALALMKQLRPAEYNELLRGWAKFAGIELSE